MNKEDYGIILDSVDGKAKGVIMPNRSNEQDIPQIVGLTKIQLFFLLIAGILVGAGVFGLGYLFHKNEEYVSFRGINKAIQDKYQIGECLNIQRNNTPQTIENEKESLISKNFYILIGKYKTIEAAQKVQNKLQIKSGKLATLKQTNDAIILFIGPFESESLARNEKNLSFQKSSIMGSITYEI